MNNTTEKKLQYRISLPRGETKIETIGKANIEWNICLTFTDGTKKYIKYFKSNLNVNKEPVTLRQTYTTYFFDKELRAFRTVVMSKVKTKEVIHFARGARECRDMITDFNLMSIRNFN